MNINELINLMVKGVSVPEMLWQEKLQEQRNWVDMLKFPILPFVALVALLNAVLILVFGYNIPFVGVIRPSPLDAFIQAVGTVITYGIAIVIMSWIAANLTKMVEGINDQHRAMLMLFLVSIPSLVGQVLGTLPFVGVFIAIGLGIYSLVLLYRAIPIFMEVPLSKSTRYLILLIIFSILVSLMINFTIGKMFVPSMPELTDITIPNLAFK